jgi:hypothetical protein
VRARENRCGSGSRYIMLRLVGLRLSCYTTLFNLFSQLERHTIISVPHIHPSIFYLRQLHLAMRSCRSLSPSPSPPCQPTPRPPMGINRNAIGSTNHSISNPPFMPQNQVDMDELVEQTEEQSRVTAAHRSDIRRARAARTGGPTLNSVSCNTGMDV